MPECGTNPMPGVNEGCPAMGYQSATVCVPVTVTPYAQPGTAHIQCCGTPTITPGIHTCGGVKNGACSFTISQEICVAVPVDFGAVTTLGDAYVGCIGATAGDNCEPCTLYGGTNAPCAPRRP